MNHIFPIVIFFGLLVCQGCNDESNEGVKTQNPSIKDTSKVKPHLAVKDTAPKTIVYPAHINNDDPEKLVSQFYSWYINDLYKKDIHGFSNHKIDKSQDGILSVDFKAHAAKLRKSGFFSEKFIGNEVQKIKACNAAAKNKTLLEDSDLMEFQECGFMFADEWIGGQGEDIEGFKIDDVKTVDDNNSIVFLHTTVPGGHPFINFKVTIGKENGLWKINSIEIK